MSEITIFNTTSRTKELFLSLHSGEVTIYHCGPTVYHFQHIGNMRRFIFADLVHRMFYLNGYKIKQVINITDVGHLVSDKDEGEDKMEKGARREGKTAQEIAEMYTADFHNDLKLLSINVANTLFPKATENIPEQIELIKTLEQKGFTYQISDGVYFDTSKDIHYADFARLDIEGMKEGARVEKNEAKRNSADFAVWKFSPLAEKRQQEWSSPWGTGFPGWHIECSAMAKKFLGTTIDVHTGGIDHVPVHHTNEIAQSKCANDAPLARYWIHNEHVDLANEKISKSGESFIRIQDLVEKGYHPLAYRYFTLLAHYRTKINFSFEGLDAARVAWKRLNEFVAKTSGDTNDTDPAIDESASNFFDHALSLFNDDLDTPKIIALLFETLKDSSLPDLYKKAVILKADEILGIIDPTYQTEETISLDSLSEEIRALIVERQKAREEKDWSKADELRATIKEKGYEIKDTVDGINIKKA